MPIITQASNTRDLCQILDTVFDKEWMQVCFSVHCHDTRMIKAFVSRNQPLETIVSLVVNGKVIEKKLSNIIKFKAKFRKDVDHNWAWLRIDIKEIKGDDSVD